MDEKATQLHAIASLKVLLDATKPQNGAATSSAANHVGNAALRAETALAPVTRQPTPPVHPPNNPDMPNGVANALAEMNLDAVCIIITVGMLVRYLVPFIKRL